MSYDAFISYSREDLALAEQIQVALEQHGLRVFRDVTDISGGTPWVSALETALATSQAVIFLISGNSLGSAWVKEERRYALTLANSRQGGPRLIPVLLD